MGRKIIKHDDIYKPIVQQICTKTDEEKAKEAYINNEHPNTMGNGSATFFYIVIMLVGAIFVSRWLIWIAASIIYFPFIFRKKIRKKQWDKIQEEKKKNGGQK